MSPPKSNSPLETPAPIRAAGAHRKPKADLYTVLLVMSLIAVLLGILFLYLFMSRYYNWELKGGPPVVWNQGSEVRGQGPGIGGERRSSAGFEVRKRVNRIANGLGQIAIFQAHDLQLVGLSAAKK